MNILFIGDIFGNPGRHAIRKLLPDLRRELEIDFCIANCENSAGGKGVTEKIGHSLIESGCDILTGGNHIFAQKTSYDYIEKEMRLVRPANYPGGAPGRGWVVHASDAGPSIAVVNLCGRAFMGPHYENPFEAMEDALHDIGRDTRLIIVDFHAETTSEKMAMGWYLDGRVTLMVGTHTHVPTADERLLHKGTAYITDVGMTGPYDSVIGDDKDIILSAMLTQMPTRFEVAPPNEVSLNAVLVTANPETGRATSIKRIRREV